MNTLDISDITGGFTTKDNDASLCGLVLKDLIRMFTYVADTDATTKNELYEIAAYAGRADSYEQINTVVDMLRYTCDNTELDVVI